jgi:hypothetical protein
MNKMIYSIAKKYNKVCFMCPKNAFKPYTLESLKLLIEIFTKFVIEGSSFEGLNLEGLNLLV